MLETVIANIDVSTLSVLVAIVAPLVGVPLTVVTFYLRAIREHQATRYSDTLQRIDAVESSIRDLTRTITEFERDYTTKEEWLRESLHARRQLEHLTEMTARVQAEIENTRAAATQFARATDALARLTRQLAGEVRPGEVSPARADKKPNRHDGGRS